jgi:elongation factor G
MTRIGIGLGEPSDEAPSPEVTVRITVPEEFAGFAMGEVNSRGGRISGIDVREGTVIVQAVLPSSEYDRLNENLASATLGHGKTEREPPPTD